MKEGSKKCIYIGAKDVINKFKISSAILAEIVVSNWRGRYISKLLTSPSLLSHIAVVHATSHLSNIQHIMQYNAINLTDIQDKPSYNHDSAYDISYLWLYYMSANLVRSAGYCTGHKPPRGGVSFAEQGAAQLTCSTLLNSKLLGAFHNTFCLQSVSWTCIT